ncbi:hypothetical protein CRENBAI_001567 [Crenichthys baileyi]|uniref:Uncharacterized protein n=1 Tax=Crenichthys baileyi TaxID=28760 RepID=A0AAV9RNP4_9TELE
MRRRSKPQISKGPPEHRNPTRDPRNPRKQPPGVSQHTPKAPSPGYREPQVQVPIGTTSPRTQEVVPFPPGVETGRPPQHLNLVWASQGSCLNLSDPSPNTELTTEPQTPHQDRSNSPSKRSPASGKHSRLAPPTLAPQPHRHTTSLPLKH